MNSPRAQRALLIGLAVNAVLLVLVLVSLLGKHDFPSVLPAAYGQTQAPIAGGAGVFVMPAQLSQNTWGCYLLDVDSQTLAVYSYSPGEKMLRFSASRTYRYDRRIQNFNTQPVPNDIRDLVEKQSQELRNNPNTTLPSSPETP